MSREVDERVVEMRFDNAQFEKNVQQSRESLEKLNRSLQLDGAEKGFEKIADASAQVDFDEMQGAVESLSDRFSALEVMGVAALVKITNQAIDTGEKLVKSLSIDQVTSGWNKYAQKTASVQTIMNATGKSITKVNSYLDKLMWYSDETSYGFTDMTASLGQLTAAGGDIDKLIPMIMGIANATAYAGKGASEFSRVIYNLNQSYSQGYLSLMDWKSVELAGVATAELKQLLIDTAVEQGKLKKGQVGIGTFGSTLKDQWADKEVMEAGFGKLAEFSMAVKNLMETNRKEYPTAAKAIEALEGQYDEVTVKAFKAAQEAKSFTEAVDATKDAVSSGWMQTFDILFGNYEEAKGFWSDLADSFWDIFASGADARNNWLKSAFDSGLDQLLGVDGFSDATDSYTNLLQKSLMRGGLITEEDVNEAGSFQKALEESGVTADQLYAVIRDAADGYARMAQLSDKELAAQKLDRDKVEKLAQAYSDLAGQIQNGSVNLDEYAGKMNQLSGREHFFNGILNILNGINSVLEPVRNAFSDVFMTDGSPLYNLLKGFDELTGKFQLSEESAAKLQKVFKGLFSTLNIGLKAIKVAVKTVWTVIEKLLDVLSPVTDLLLEIGSRVGDVLSWMSESMGQAESLTDVLAILAGAIASLISPITDVWKGFKAFVRGGDAKAAGAQFSAFGVVVNTVGSVLEKFKIGSVSAGGVIGTAFQVLGGILLAAFDGVEKLIGNAFGGLKTAGKTVEDFKDKQVTNLENIRDTVVSLPEKAEAAIKDFGGTMGTVMNRVAEACKTALGAIRDFFNLQDGVDLYRLLALIDVGALALGIGFVAKALNAVSTATKNLLKNPVTNFFDALTNAVNNWNKAHTTNNLVTAAKGIATAVALISGSIYLLSTIKDPEAGLEALKTVLISIMTMLLSMKVLAATDLTGLDTGKLVASVIAMSAGVAAMASAVVKVGSMHTYQVENGINAISRIAAMLAGMVGLLSLYNGRLGGVKGAGSFAAAAAAVDAIALALIPLAMAANAGLDLEAACEVINGVAIALSILMTTAAFAKKLAGKTDVKTLDSIIEFVAKVGTLTLAMDGMAAALLMTAGAVAAFAAIGNLKKGLGAAVGMLAAMALAIGLLSKFGGKAKKMRAGAEAMLIASASMIVMAEALKRMNEAMSADASGAGAAGLALALIGLSAAIGMLSKHAMESAATAVALVAMGAGLVEMAFAIKMLADVPFWTIMGNIAALGTGLAVLISLSGALPVATAGITGIAGAILMLATALLLLAPACYLLSGLSLDQALAGFTGMLAILVGLGIIGSAPAIAVGLEAVAVAIYGLAKAFNVFASGLIKVSVAAGIMALISLFAGPLKEVITGAAEDIKTTLETIIDVIAAVIIDKAEVISKTLSTVAIIVLSALGDVLVWSWDNVLEPALEWLWAKISAFFSEKGTEFSKRWNPLDMSGWADTFTANDRFFGKVFGTVTDPFLAPFGTSLNDLGNQLEDSMNGVKDTAEEAGKASQQVLDDTKKNVAETTDQANKATEAVSIAARKTEENGYTALRASNDYGDTVIYVAQKNSDMADSMDDLAGSTDAAGTAMSNAAAETTNAANITQQNSDKIGAVATQIKSEEGTVEKTAVEAADNITSAGNDIAEENGGNLITNWIDGILAKLGIEAPKATGAIQGAVKNMLGNVEIPDVKTVMNNAGSFVKHLPEDAVNALTGKSGLTDEDLAEEAKKDEDDKDKNPVTTGTTKSSSGTKKTVAQQIEEKYKTQLEANKTLREITDNEYELWLAENENTADADTLLAKKAENAAAEIANQTDRVAIAQAKYDEMTKRWGADKQETKEAYNALLEEKTSLAKLKADQYTNLFEQITKRYDTDLDTLEKEYNLWTAQTDGTATDLDKIDRETKYMQDELEIKLKKEEKAKEQYDILKEKQGEASLETQEAYNDWLDAQTESLELQNEIAKQGLEKLDKRLEQISDAQSRMQTRMQLLDSIYDDGSLADRADAYKQAVETYGENSAQAQKAKFQGVTTSILGTVGALQSMTRELQTTYELQKAIEADGAKDDGDNSKWDEKTRKEKEDQLLSSRSALIGFAGNLADAMNLDDTGKKLVIKLANAVQKNWSKLSDKFNELLAKLPDGTRDKLRDTFGAMFSEEGMEIGTEFISAIASAIQGDYAGALISAMTGIIDLLSTDAGQQLAMNLTNALASALPEIQNGTGKIADAVGLLGQAVSGSGGMTGLLTQIAAGSGGAEAGLAGIGEAVAGLGATIVEILPELLIVVGIIAAIAAVIGGIAAFIGWKKQQSRQKDVSHDIGAEIDKEIADGVKEDGPVVGDAVDTVTEDAMTVAKNTLAAVSRVLDSDYEYTPQITPVVDLTNVVEGAEEIDSTFAATKSLSLDGDVSRNLASQIDAEVQLQNGLKNRSNDDTLAAINALGGHMDGIAENIRNMKLTINGRKTIGYIDDRMGRLAGAKL